ncbi:MAG: Rrf2 family transcriptional regulator [Planctomycetia bacterium]|nr:Rrf2 family transcriptional regulator [Planctomycetia bacterium]MCC7314398.1 Rrf2 family transcriptional regulator [Planctomycetota bacterium]
MISQTAQYAIRAMVAIASEDGPILARQIAKATAIPRPYLSTVLRLAVRAGMLHSSRGRGGGFVLARPAEQLTLFDIVAAFDDVGQGPRCPFGLPQCTDAQACPMHEVWKPVSQGFRNMLMKTALSEIVGGNGPSRGGRKSRMPRRSGIQR